MNKSTWNDKGGCWALKLLLCVMCNNIITEIYDVSYIQDTPGLFVGYLLSFKRVFIVSAQYLMEYRIVVETNFISGS